MDLNASLNKHPQTSINKQSWYFVDQLLYGANNTKSIACGGAKINSLFHQGWWDASPWMLRFVMWCVCFYPVSGFSGSTWEAVELGMGLIRCCLLTSGMGLCLSTIFTEVTFLWSNQVRWGVHVDKSTFVVLVQPEIQIHLWSPIQITPNVNILCSLHCIGGWCQCGMTADVKAGSCECLGRRDTSLWIQCYLMYCVCVWSSTWIIRITLSSRGIYRTIQRTRLPVQGKGCIPMRFVLDEICETYECTLQKVEFVIHNAFELACQVWIQRFCVFIILSYVETLEHSMKHLHSGNQITHKPFRFIFWWMAQIWFSGHSRLKSW